jgi:abnormal spindle-like microcephaly-associated protein
LQRSQDFLLLLSRELLKGEGDVIKHVSHYGYVLTVEQSALDEFDYKVQRYSRDSAACRELCQPWLE